MSGRLDHAYQNAWELVKGKWVDPIAGCLGGYILLRLGKVLELRTAFSNMTRYFNEISDSHILYGEYMASSNNDSYAKDDFIMALDKGMPIVSDGLLRLFDRIQWYDIPHSRRSLLEKMFHKRIRGLLWAAWTPDELSPDMEL